MATTTSVTPVENTSNASARSVRRATAHSPSNCAYSHTAGTHEDMSGGE